MDNNIFAEINKLYIKTGFIASYGFDVWVAIIICIVFFIITTYFYILNNIEPIAADWENQRCNPSVLPFAGLINKGLNETAFESTGKNFTGCIQSILTNIVAYAFQPIYYIMNNLTSSFSESLNSINSIRAMFDKVRVSIDEFSTETMGRVLNITMPIVQMMIVFKSIGAKMVGILTSSMFTLFGSYLTLKSFMLFIMQLITVILYALAGMIIAFVIISFIPFFGSWAIPVAATNIAIMIAILIPTVIMQIFMSNVLSLSSRNLPDVPRCFSGNTIIDNKFIKDIDVGDLLDSGETVTAVMKFSANGQKIYNLYGVHVTGEHRVFHDTLGWIKVKNHPASMLIYNFEEPFVYCIGTDSKTFIIGNQLYSDWDDVDEQVVASLKNKCLDLPHNFNNTDIHDYIDNGILATSLVELKTGELIPIKDIKVNDILSNNVQVLGIIKIDATKLKNIYEYNINNNYLNNNKIIGSNITVCLGNICTKKTFINERVDNYLYQLITSSGSYKVSGSYIKDYNYGIDKYTNI